jgi:hypothetical protein
MKYYVHSLLALISFEILARSAGSDSRLRSFDLLPVATSAENNSSGDVSAVPCCLLK